MFLAHPEAHRCRILRGVTRALKPTIKCDVQITRRSHLKSSSKEGTRKISFLWVMITNEWTNVRTSTLARGQAWESSEITFYASKQSEREGNEVRPEIWPLPSSDVEVFLFFGIHILNIISKSNRHRLFISDAFTLCITKTALTLLVH